jgi:predicted RNA methylase
MASHIDPTFDTMYGGEHATTDMVPWDIGGPQPVVQQLVAYGGARGRVLDAGTGPGYHAIHCASHGYPVVGVERRRRRSTEQSTTRSAPAYASTFK